MCTGSTIKFIVFLALVVTPQHGFAKPIAPAQPPRDPAYNHRFSAPSLPVQETRNDPYGSIFAAEVSGLPINGARINGGGTRLLDWGTGVFSIDGARVHSGYRSTFDGPMSHHGRGASLVAGFHIQQDLGNGSSFFAAVAGQREHHGSSIDLIARHWMHSSGVGLEAGIIHDERLRFLAGYSRSNGPGLGGLERSVALTRGAAVDNKGFRLALDFSPQGFLRPRSPVFGIALRRFNLSGLDTAALGASRPAVTSVALSFRAAF
jgi:hypothetical protein